MSSDSGHDDDQAHTRNERADLANEVPSGAAPTLEGEEALKSLLHAVGEVARSDDAEAAAFSAGEAVVGLSSGARDRLVETLSRSRSRDGGSKAGRVARRRVFLAAGAGSVAAAAALLLWIRSGSEDASLPAYSITAEGGEKDIRGGPAAAGEGPTVAALQKVRGTSELVVSLRPDTAVSEPTSARAFVVRDGEVAEVRAVLRVAPSGAVQLVVRGADLRDGRSGQALLRVAVGRPRALERVDPQRVARQASGPGWRALTVPLVFEGD